MGIVPADAKQSVLDDLVARINAYHPGGSGPHISPAARSRCSRSTRC